MKKKSLDVHFNSEHITLKVNCEAQYVKFVSKTFRGHTDISVKKNND
jgi:hypothetical protein